MRLFNSVMVVVFALVFMTAFLSPSKPLRSWVPEEYIITKSGDTAYAKYDTVIYKKYVIR